MTSTMDSGGGIESKTDVVEDSHDIEAFEGEKDPETATAQTIETTIYGSTFQYGVQQGSKNVFSGLPLALKTDIDDLPHAKPSPSTPLNPSETATKVQDDPPTITIQSTHDSSHTEEGPTSPEDQETGATVPTVEETAEQEFSVGTTQYQPADALPEEDPFTINDNHDIYQSAQDDILTEHEDVRDVRENPPSVPPVLEPEVDTMPSHEPGQTAAPVDVFGDPEGGGHNPFDEIGNIRKDPETVDTVQHQSDNVFDEINDPESQTYNPFDSIGSNAQGYENGIREKLQNHQFSEQQYEPQSHGHDFLDDPEAGDPWPQGQQDELFDDRPDPESQGYTLLDDEENQPQNEPDMAGESETETSTEIANAGTKMSPTQDSLSPLSQEEQANSHGVSAFSQIQGSLSEHRLELVAHELVDPSEDVSKVIETLEQTGIEDKNDNNDDLWGNSGTNGFDFGASESAERLEDVFGHVNNVSQLHETTQKTDDTLPQTTDQTDTLPLDPTNSDPFATDDLLDDEDFSNLFSGSTQNEAQPPPKQDLAATTFTTMDSVFGDTSDAANLFNSPGNFPISTTDVPPSEPESTQIQGVSYAFEEVPVAENTGGTGDVTDDLDFIDDSEFMAAFGGVSESGTPSAQSTVPSTSVTQPHTTRYAPKQVEPQVPQVTPQIGTYTPLVVTRPASISISSPAPLVSAPTTQTSRAVSSKYVPASTAQPPYPATSANQPTRSPPTSNWSSPQTAWTQPSTSITPAQQAGKPATKSSSSFVIAKGGYQSPYDLPEQLAPKIKRHVPPSIPIHQQPPPSEVRPPLSAKPPMDTRSPTYPGPPPRAASAQPGFPQQSFPPPPPQAPPTRALPPQRLISPAPASISSQPPSSRYAPGRMSLPPMHQEPMYQQPQQPNVYGRQSMSPPRSDHSFTGHTEPTRRYASPPMHEQAYPSRTQTASQPPPNQFGPGQSGIPPRRLSNQFTSHQAGSPPQPPTGYPGVPNYIQQQRTMSPPYQHPPPSHPPLAGESQQQIYRRPSQPTYPLPIMDEPAEYANEPSHQYRDQGNLYQEEMGHMEDPNAGLPPHFEMEREDWHQEYSTDRAVPPSVPYPSRQFQKTPEPIPQQQLTVDEISPPRTWERAPAQLPRVSTPPRTRSVSSYDPPPKALGVAPVSPERHRNISPQMTRQRVPSPRKDPIADRAMSYPSRKPPAHLKFQAEPAAQLTPEEDFRLKRQGCPVVVFGFGGRMITMIPRTPHRVNIHGMAPAPIPGPITLSSLRGVLEPTGLASSFPGPLFASNKLVKGKVKEIVNWLDQNISTLDQLRDTQAMDEEDIIRVEDRKVLYKLVKVLVENNGVLDGSPEIEKQVRNLLIPQAEKTGTDETQSFGITASSLATSTAPQTSVDPTALATYNLTNDFLRSMRDLLIQGDRAGAIRKAVDQKMWGHALLIASSVSPIVWRETAEQFVRYELRETGVKDFDSLRFLYGVFANEGIDSVSELLPPANRMVSSIHASSASQGPRLTSWKESLGMILANKRPVDDPAPIIGLGNALVKDGRVEAGHACFLLSKSAPFSAIDMPDTQYTLLGGDVNGKANLIGLPQVLLSEIFEYAQSKFVPEGFMHLLPYKLWHAWALTDYGYTDLSEKYCESIGATLQKEKRGSIFINQLTIAVLKDLTERIAEGPHESFTEKSSWFGKKSLKGGDNFWKALETNLTKFVAGGDEPVEESPAGAPAKKSLEVQDPRFGRIASETAINRMASLPNLRAQATTPIYSSFPAEVGRTPGSHSRYSTATSESRYNPAARYEYQPVQEGSHDYENAPNALAAPINFGTPESINMGYSPYVPPPASAPPIEVHHYEIPEPVQEPIQEEEPVKEEKEPEKPKTKPKEEDEKKAASDKSSGGWFGGWFKRGTTQEQGTPGKPIKAKLGEESSFYYDKDLKKWVNKKVGATAAAAPPPPPPPSKKVAKPAAATTPAPTPTTISEVPQPSPAAPVIPATQIHPPVPPATATPPAEVPAAKPSLPPSRSSSTAPALPVPGQKVDPLEALLATRPASGAGSRGARKPARSRYVDVMNK